MQKFLPDPPASIEVNLRQLSHNWETIRRDKPAGLHIAAVVKDDAYGHGAVKVGRVALEHGATFLAVATVLEGIELRQAGITAPILILGERSAADFEGCLDFHLTPTVGSSDALEALARVLRNRNEPMSIHLKVDSGMSRHGFRWTEMDKIPDLLRNAGEIRVEGVMSHFAMSDELDKSFARLQLSRFNEAVAALGRLGIHPQFRHICNSGGFLDLPEAHFNLVRVGILGLGVFPSKVCRRMDGIAPVMSIRSRIAAIKTLQPGDHVGYGMRFTAPVEMRIGIVPAGYGAGFPRVRNQGRLLVRGRSAAIVGGVSMDAISVDLSGISAEVGDQVTLLGRDGDEEITIHELAELRGSVSYDAMVSWSARLPRVYIS